MGQQDDGQEKTEQATPYRLEEAAKKGQIPYSQELTGGLLFLALIMTTWLFGHEIVAKMATELERGFQFLDVHRINEDAIASHLADYGNRLLDILMPILLAAMVICVFGGLLQTGFKFAGKKIEPKLDKIDPFQGMKKLFSMRSVMMVLFSLVKVIIVATIVILTIQEALPISGSLGGHDTIAIVTLFPSFVWKMGFRIAALVLVLGILDLLWQRWKHTKEMMMSKQDVKEDMKRSEGDPKIKARVREVQREMARARMMSDVKQATVVIRNPTHYAVALRYDRDKDPTPRVVAKGKNFIALRIIEIAEEAKVPVRTDPPLARRLHDLVPLGKTVPEELFRAVARIIAWVLQRTEAKEGAR